MPIAYNPISLGQIQSEFGGSNPIALAGEYYRGAGYTTENNTNVPTSGTIALSNFYSAYRGYQVEMYFSREAGDTNHFFLDAPGFDRIDITTPVDGGGSIITYYIPTKVFYKITGYNDNGYNVGIRQNGNAMQLEDRIDSGDNDWNDLEWAPGAGVIYGPPISNDGNFYYYLNP